MRKLILMALAGYLWKRFSERRNAGSNAADAPMSPSGQAPSPW